MTLLRPCDRGIVVIDYGSQYTLLIARRLRELGVYSEIIGSEATEPKDFQVEGIILSGGPDSVGDEGSRKIPSWVMDKKIPLLGICYGLHLLAEYFGGKVRAAAQREYGAEQLSLAPGFAQEKLLGQIPDGSMVWMSHGDDVALLPSSFKLLAFTAKEQVLAACRHKDLPIYGLQFHPEVYHSEYGKQMLENFCYQICHNKQNWFAQNRLEYLKTWIHSQVDKDSKILVAASGGVDSTVATALLSKALGNERVHAVLVDTGLLRKGEATWVEEALKRAHVTHFTVLRRQELFLQKLAGVSDPEQKRKIIGRTFIEVFEDFAHGQGFTHLAQGTLYPDVIESAGHGSGAKVIKSHHNVGGLPERLKLKLLEPFRYLFKDEVRALGEDLGLPHELVMRHPFPGPGLGIRILGEIKEADLELLREADAIFIQALRDEGLYSETWQAFAVLLPIKTVGVMGDNRTYERTLALRAVDASDGMTASASALPMDFLLKTADTIVRKVRGINRVVYDITGKPPATIEWE